MKVVNFFGFLNSFSYIMRLQLLQFSAMGDISKLCREAVLNLFELK